MGPIVVIILRLVAPLIILRRPLLGGCIAIFLDSVDFVIFNYFGWGFLAGPGFEYSYLGAHVDKYQMLDKLLDAYYLSLEAYTVRFWQDAGARIIVYSLYVWRLLGIAVFFFMPYEYVFLIFPNIFENVFLLFIIFRQTVRLEPVKLLLIMAVSIMQKILQEYTLHFLAIDYFKFLQESVSNTLKSLGRHLVNRG